MPDQFIVGFCPACQRLLVPLHDDCPTCREELLGVCLPQVPPGLGDPAKLAALPSCIEVGLPDPHEHAVLIAELLLLSHRQDLAA